MAVPKGYLSYWNEEVGDELAAEVFENQELEDAFNNQQQRHFHFATSSTQWTFNGAFGVLVLVMPWGPVIMAMGCVVGGLLGFSLSLANDVCRLRRRQTASTRQCRRIDNLMRWANFHFATSISQLQIVFKVIIEYQVLAQLGDSSKTARSQLKLLKKPPEVVRRMATLLEDDAVAAVFTSVKCARPAEREVEKQANAILYADTSKELYKHVMKGGDLMQVFRGEKQISDMSGRLPNTSSDERSEEPSVDSQVIVLPAQGTDAGATTLDTGSGATGIQRGGYMISAGDLEPMSSFNVALAARTESSSEEPGGDEKLLVYQESSVSDGPPAVAEYMPEPSGARVSAEDNVAPTVDSGAPRLFNSYEDMANFDLTLKHQTPIGLYEYAFLDGFMAITEGDPKWEITVATPTVQVYKYNSPDSPVVLVKAYATLDGIPVNVLCHHIRHIPTRLKWDSTFADYRVVEQDVAGCEIIYCIMKAPFPVANRDFLQWRRTDEDAESQVYKMLMRSADHPSVPEKAGVIRAETIISGYVMAKHPEDSKSSTLFILAQTDVKGLIPKWIVNTTAARAPVGWVDNLKKACIAYLKVNGDFVPPYDPLK